MATELRKTQRLLFPECRSDVLLKLELTNPTGTQKDRVAEPVVQQAKRQGYSCVTAGSCGNYGVSLAYYAARLGLSCDVFVPCHYGGSRSQEIKNYGGRVHCERGTYEDAVARSRNYAAQSQSYDANPFGEAAAIALLAYERLALEIIGQLSAKPASVWVPVGNGTTLGGLYRGFSKLGMIPRIGAVGSVGNTAATASARLGHVITLNRQSLHETIVNEPLVNWKSIHADLVIQAIQSSEGWVYESTDDEMRPAARILLNCEGIAVAPAAAAVLAAFSNTPSAFNSDGPHVLVLTSKAFDKPGQSACPQDCV